MTRQRRQSFPVRSASARSVRAKPQASPSVEHVVVADFFPGPCQPAVEQMHQRMWPVDHLDQPLKQPQQGIATEDVGRFMNQDVSATTEERAHRSAPQAR